MDGNLLMWGRFFIKQILKQRSFLPQDIEKYINQHFNESIFIPNFLNFIKSLEKSNSILIMGDYDVDGITSSAILYFTLKNLFINKQIKVFIPNRFVHGYGLNPTSLNFLLKNFKHKIDTLITVDNGINSISEVEVLKNEGLNVIIIDHHKVERKDIKANLIVHPFFFDLGYSYLCASGIVYKLSSYLLNWIKNSERLEKVFSFLAGMATIADVVPLLEDNRKLVKKLFKLLKQNFIPLEIKKLFEKAYGKEIIPTKTFHFSHIIIPRLNAPGRIDNPYVSFQLIYNVIKNSYYSIEDTSSNLENLLRKIEEINKTRQELQKIVFDKVMKNIKEKELYKDNIIIPDYIVSNGLELGVIGIVAGKISNIYKKPVFVFVKIDNTLKGSVRNPVDKIDIIEIISNFKDLVYKFGGHKKAAGIELKIENFESFRNKIANFSIKEYAYNIDLELSYFLLEKFIKNIDKIVEIMEPFGEKNEKPIIKLTKPKLLKKIENLQGFSCIEFENKKVIINQNLQLNLPLYLKFDKLTNNFVYFEELKNENVLKDIQDEKPNLIKILPSLKIPLYNNKIHFIKIKTKNLQSFLYLLNSYEEFIILASKENYLKIKENILSKHFILCEPSIKRLIELIKILPEDTFFNKEDIVRGVIIFCIDFFDSLYDFFEKQKFANKKENEEVIYNFGKGVVIVKLNYINNDN